MIYLVIAYAFAVLLLGGYLISSLRRLREMEKKSVTLDQLADPRFDPRLAGR